MTQQSQNISVAKRPGKPTYLLFLLALAVSSTPGSARAQLTSNELTVANAGLLELISANAIPSEASYLSWQHPWQIILPGNVFLSIGVDLDTYDLGNGRILLDDRLFDYDSLQPIFLQNQHSRFAQNQSENDFESGGMDSLLSFSTNDFFLELVSVTGISNPAGPSAYLTVHHPEPSQVFDLFFTPSLPVTNHWYWIARGLPCQTNFTIVNLPFATGFFMAGTTNGMDTNGLSAAYRYMVGGSGSLTNDFDADGLPDVWEITYFGDLSQSGTNDFDNNFQSNADAYSSGADPNVIEFSVRFPTYHVNSSTVSGSIQIEAGLPSQMAILVNSTNFDSANWQPYTQSFSVSLGSTNGVYGVWIGLRGRAPKSLKTWGWSQLVLESQPPEIIITEPIASLTSQPIIQLRGYCSRPILSLSYDLSSSAGVTHGKGYVTDQHLDRFTFQFTTNWFECTDVELTGATNVITLRATDLAGNSSTNVYTYILDFSHDTNPPVATVLWPKDGELVASDQFTIRARIDDPTATVIAEVVAASGNTNIAFGLVERNGLLWVENVPLGPGTNLISLRMADAAGNLSTTNLTVVKSDVMMTIGNVADSYLKGTRAVVTGTITSSNHAVWVNGIRASDPVPIGQGVFHWSAWPVPLNNGGTAIIQARAIPNSVNSGNGSGQDAAAVGGPPPNPNAAGALTAESDPERPTFIAVKTYHYDYKDTWEVHGVVPDGSTWRDEVDHETDKSDWVNSMGVTNGGGGGTATYLFDSTNTDWSGNISAGWVLDDLASPPDSWPPTLPSCGTNYSYGYINGGYAEYEECYGPIFYPNASVAEKTYYGWQTDDGSHGFSGYDNTERVTLLLSTSGKGSSTKQKLLRIAAWASTFDHWYKYYGWPNQPVSPSSMQIFGENLSPTSPGGTNAYNYYVQAANVTRDVSLNIAAQRKRFEEGVDDCKLRIVWSGHGDVTDSNVVTVVGQKITLSCTLLAPTDTNRPPLTNFQWTIPETAVADFYVSSDSKTGMVITPFLKTSSNVTFCWVSGDKKKVECTAEVLGKKISAEATFSVIKPEVNFVGTTDTTPGVETNHEGNGSIFIHFGGFTAGGVATNGIHCTSQNPEVFGWGQQSAYGFVAAQTISDYTVTGTRADLSTTNISSAGLDNEFPVTTLGDGDGTSFSDAPGVIIRVNSTNIVGLSVTGSFRAVLMFQTFEPSIPVPLKEILWNWSGQAARSGGGWTAVQSNCFVNISANDRITQQFPYWTNKVIAEITRQW